jgi:Lipoprotein amino terminal region
MNEKAKSARNSMRSVYLTALGNAGFTETISLLSSFARDQKATPYQRVSAIVAMRHLVFIEPKETSRVLLKIYHSTTYPNSVRVAALSMLLYSQPQLYIWQRIAVSTWFEPSMSLQTFIYSSIRSIAANKDPVYQKMFVTTFVNQEQNILKNLDLSGLVMQRLSCPLSKLLLLVLIDPTTRSAHL